jgi:catechol 2,3-dioxygenase
MTVAATDTRASMSQVNHQQVNQQGKQQVNQTEGKPRRGCFRPRRLGHANLFVSDYEQATEFYKSVVGFEEVYRQPDNQASFLSNGNTYHDLALTDIRSKYAAKGQKPGLWHLAFEVETEQELVEDYSRAKAAGVEFSFVMDHDVARSVYKNDPDGNMVEIYADVESDWRAMRQGIIIKEKPQWVPGVSSTPLTEKNYPASPDLVVVEAAIFHPRKVTHVALVAEHFEQMHDYYVGILGLEPLTGSRNGSSAVLRGHASAGDVTLYRKSAGLAPGLHHVGFEVWDEADLRPSIGALAGKGVEVEREIDHPARHSIMIRDPDGLRLQFFVNRQWDPSVIAKSGQDESLYLL